MKRNIIGLLAVFAFLPFSRSFAQELTDAFVSDTLTVWHMYRTSDGFLAKASTVNLPYQNHYILKFDENGNVSGSVCWFAEGETTEGFNWESEMSATVDGKTGFVYLTRQNGTASLYSVSVTDDLEIESRKFKWTGLDVRPYDGWYEPMAVFCKDGSVIFSYSVDILFFPNESQGIRILKFSDNGDLMAEKLFESLPFQDAYPMFSSPDSLGCCLIARSEVRYDESGIVLDGNLNQVYYKDCINNLSYPKLFCGYMYASLNPFNNRTYGISNFSYPAFGQNPAIENDLFMTVFDEEFNQLAFCWGPATPSSDERALRKAIDYGGDGSVYMCGWMGFNASWGLYVAHFDEDLNRYGEIYYQDNERGLAPHSVCAYPDGCWICCDGYNRRTNEQENCIYRIKNETFVSVDEAHTAGFAVAIAYPNPGGNEMHIRTAVENAAVEVYDMNGRLVAQQPVTETETVLDATDWAAGTYVWKVVSTQTTREIESGKWVKK